MPSTTRYAARGLGPEFYSKIDGAIERYGNFLLAVPSFDECFIYTIGNASRGLPELLMFAPQSWGHILNDVSQMLRERGRAFEHGDKVMIPTDMGDYPVMIADIDQDRARDEYTVQAGQYLYHDGYRVQQVIPSDVRRRFPHEAGYKGPPQRMLNSAPLPRVAWLVT